MKTIILNSLALACLLLAPSCVSDEQYEHRDHDDHRDHRDHQTRSTTTTTEQVTTRDPRYGRTVETETVRRY